MELVEGRATIEDVDEFVARLGTIGDEHDCTVQAFDARYIVSRTHLDRALSLADRARERGEAIARERAVEILLYTAGRRQIQQALELGVGEGDQPVVVLVTAEEGGDERAAADEIEPLLDAADTLGDFDEQRVREFFDISKRELAATDAALADLVHERVALLDVEK
ncbi:KEOPS complex subunit Cgi121 [Halococcus thailandensis]|uniref:KEOPS complex Cgi121-like subunit n=1 Tax=Halococcus thailandensis JCM 13552 TaxID=1227457 RepID=M0N7E3_9EURY|nr:KEOPS complex subunit Cgi121 [Halococcus thailandensis]EMA53796.1 KEOPS complex Cgi121-like subunit [Halococcus thailandensis JCM 13552]